MSLLTLTASTPADPKPVGPGSVGSDPVSHTTDGPSPAARATAARPPRGRTWPLVVGLVVLLAAAWASLSVGVIHVPLQDLFHPDERQWQLLTLSRLPRLAAILLAGSSLAVAGLVMQRITQNSFVSPSTSGTTEAAVLGVLIATLAFPGASLLTKMVFAIIVSILGTFGFLQIVQRVRGSDPVVVALIGLMYGGVIGAVTTFVAYQLDLLQLLDMWTAGSFSDMLAGQYEPLWAVLVLFVVGYVFADRFTVVGMGRDFATNLGVNYTVVLNVGLVVVSVIAAVVVVVVGAIPFLGLIVPNIVSLVMGDDVRRALPVTALGGAGFVLLCDVIGRVVISPYEIPVATIAGVIGAGVFLVLILRAAGRRPAR